jgi:hypothetical protein
MSTATTLTPQPGAPSHVTSATQCIDRRIAHTMKCPSCQRRGMSYHPMHQSRQYVAVAKCRCGGREEL